MSKKWLLFLLLSSLSLRGFCLQNISDNGRFLDSTSIYINNNLALSKAYFDSIVNPSEENLKKDIARYYYFKAKLENEDYQLSSSIQNYIKSVSFAEKYNQLEFAALSSGEIASHFYISKKDSMAAIYYHKAFAYYTQLDDQEGLLDLMQFPAYAKYVNSEMQESIDLVLKDLEVYKAVEGDQMYYSFAIFLLTSNYLHLNDIEKARYYDSIYRSLEGHQYIESDYYWHYKNAIHTCFADYFLQEKTLDSLKYHLDAIRLEKGSSDYNVRKDMYRLYAAYYKEVSDLEKAQLYIDSLNTFNEELLSNTITTSLDINEDLSKTALQLSNEISAKKKSNTYVYILLLAICTLLVLLLLFFRKKRKRDLAYSEMKTDFSSLKMKQEKLSVINLEFEEFLNTLKKEVKRIAHLSSIDEQRESIHRLYKEIHLNDSNFVKSEDHYRLLSTLNEPFFETIEKKHPQLDSLEVQISYYLFAGFKNREIAMFTDRSLRAVESKRYRIAKKLKVHTKEESLKEYLERTFN